MSNTINPLVLNELVKDLNEALEELRTLSLTETAKIITLSHIQGTLLTISSEAMAMVADTAKVIGSTTNAATSATDDIIKAITSKIDNNSN
jgi:hypothetical protein